MPAAADDIYLDWNATSPVHPEVIEAVSLALRNEYGNPSAPYALGRAAGERIRCARRRVASLLGAKGPDSIILTGGGTEANNLALKGTFFARTALARGHIVITAIEHPSVAEPCAWLTAHGAELTVVPVDHSGRVDPAAVEDAFRPNTLLVAVMHANNETGVLQPVAEICRRARSRNILVHVDGVQAAGRVPVDVVALDCDSYAVSAHKFGGPKGVGALYVRDRDALEWVQQGGHQEQGLRAGTENVPGIVGMGVAAELAERDLERNMAHCLGLRAVFEQLTERLSMTRLNGHGVERLPNTVNLCCLYADAMSVVLALSAQGIHVGTGSACASHRQAPSRVLMAMGLSELAAYCSIRISVGPRLTEDQARHAVERIAETVEQVRLVTAPEDIGSCDEDCPCFLTEEGL